MFPDWIFSAQKIGGFEYFFVFFLFGESISGPISVETCFERDTERDTQRDTERDTERGSERDSETCLKQIPKQIPGK